jgi:hypothetical protein
VGFDMEAGTRQAPIDAGAPGLIEELGFADLPLVEKGMTDAVCIKAKGETMTYGLLGPDRSASSTAGFSDSEGDRAPENLFPVHPARSVRRKSRAEGEATVGLRSGAVRAVNRKAAKRRGRMRLQRNLYYVIALIVGAAGIASSLLLWALVKGYPCVGMDVSPCRHTLMPMLVGSGTVVLAAGIALLGTRTE